MILVRIFLIGLIVYMIVRSFVRYGNENDHSRQEGASGNESRVAGKKISKQVGEYIDYEEIENKN